MINSDQHSLSRQIPLPQGWDFNDEEIRRGISEDRMLMLTIFTGKACNLSCPYCFVKGWQSDHEDLSLCEYKELIKQAKQLGVRSIWWVGSGEPMMYRYWRELVDYITQEELWIGIFSNGTLLGIKEAEFLIERNVTLYVKMNSFNAEIQERLVGSINGAYERIQANIGHLIDIGFNTHRRLAIETVITYLNIKEIPRIYRWARTHYIIPLIEMLEYANIEAKSLDVPLQQHVDLFKELSNIDDTEYGYSWSPSVPWAGPRCRNLYLGLAVDHNGSIQPCSGLRVNLGNIREKSLKHFWELEFAKRFRTPEIIEPDKWANGRLGSYGCKSHALHVTKNPFAIDPRSIAFEEME